MSFQCPKCGELDTQLLSIMAQISRHRRKLLSFARNSVAAKYPEPRKRHWIVWYLIGSFFGCLIGSLAGALMGRLFYAAGAGQHATYLGKSYTYIVVTVATGMVFSWRAIRYNKTTYYDVFSKWQKQIICMRCSTVFTPDEPQQTAG